MKNFNLFEDSNNLKQAPLASRMRPTKCKSNCKYNKCIFL